MVRAHSAQVKINSINLISQNGEQQRLRKEERYILIAFKMDITYFVCFNTPFQNKMSIIKLINVIN